MSLLDNLIDTSGLERRLDEHGERITTLESQTPGVESPEHDSATVRVADICDDGDDVAAAILAHLSEQDRVCHEFVLEGDRAHRWDTCIDLREIEYDHFAVVGEPQATVRVEPEVSLLCRLSGPSHCLKNLRVDIRGGVADAGLARVATTECGEFENLRLIGHRDKYGSDGDRHTLRVNATREDAVNIVRNVALPDGDTPHADESRAGHAIAFSSEAGHVGTNIWEGCAVEGFIDNVFYMSGGDGSNILQGCRTKNIAGTHFRLGERDRAQDCHALQESSPGGHAWTGLWAERGSPTFEGVTLEAADSTTRSGELVRDNSAGGTWRDVEVVDKRPISQSRSVRFHASGRVDVERCKFVDSTKSENDYHIYLKYGDIHFRDCEFVNRAPNGRDGILTYTNHINAVSFEGCSWMGMNGGDALRLRDHANNWRIRDCDFGGCRVVIADGVAARRWQFAGNRCSGKDSLSDRCLGWLGAGTNWGFDHPGEPVSSGGGSGNW